MSLHPDYPPDFHFRHKNLYYKVGTHGFLFVWIRGAWKRSTIDKSKGKMSIKDLRLQKILGILQLSSTQQMNIVEVNGKHQIISGPKLLLELPNSDFDEMTVHAILEKAGVKER